MKYEYEQTLPANTTTTIKWSDVVSHTVGNSMKQCSRHQVDVDNQVTLGFVTGTQVNPGVTGTHTGLDAYEIDGVTAIKVTTGANATLVTIYGR